MLPRRLELWQFDSLDVKFLPKGRTLSFAKILRRAAKWKYNNK